jgi:hypothetical protein
VGPWHTGQIESQHEFQYHQDIGLRHTNAHDVDSKKAAFEEIQEDEEVGEVSAADDEVGVADDIQDAISQLLTQLGRAHLDIYPTNSDNVQNRSSGQDRNRYKGDQGSTSLIARQQRQQERPRQRRNARISSSSSTSSQANDQRASDIRNAVGAPKLQSGWYRLSDDAKKQVGVSRLHPVARMDIGCIYLGA